MRALIAWMSQGVERSEENPSLKFLVKIAAALGAEPAALLVRGEPD
jgi:hypothetical protein